MARIRCKYLDCTFLEDGICSATTIELDPDEGCLTYSLLVDPFEEEDWDEDEDLDGYDEWEDDDYYEDELYDEEY